MVRFEVIWLIPCSCPPSLVFLHIGFELIRMFLEYLVAPTCNDRLLRRRVDLMKSMLVLVVIRCEQQYL